MQNIKFDKSILYGIFSAIIFGFFIGNIFNQIEFSGIKLIPLPINRYLFAFLIPLVYLYKKSQKFRFVIFSGIGVGLFLSDFADFITLMSNTSQIILFVCFYLYYILCLFLYNRLKTWKR